LVTLSWRQRSSTTWVLSLVSDVQRIATALLFLVFTTLLLSYLDFCDGFEASVDAAVHGMRAGNPGALLLMSWRGGCSCWLVTLSWRQRLSTTWVHSLVSGVCVNVAMLWPQHGRSYVLRTLQASSWSHCKRFEPPCMHHVVPLHTSWF
jgi:hypothetical protein